MGADVQIDMATSAVEPVGSVRVVGRPLRPIDLGAHDVAAAIDEIPVLLALATQADGITTINGAAELRLKESDRLEGMADGLARMGASVEQRHDGITVRGPSALRGATVQSNGDHRIVMAFAVAAGMAARGPAGRLRRPRELLLRSGMS